MKSCNLIHLIHFVPFFRDLLREKLYRKRSRNLHVMCIKCIKMRITGRPDLILKYCGRFYDLRLLAAGDFKGEGGNGDEGEEFEKM